MQQTVYHHPGLSSVDKIKRAIVKSMAETTVWRSHCQFITFITFLFTVNVIRQMAPLFSKVDSNQLWHDVQHEQNAICAQFRKDLFNISKVIGRKKVAQFFLTHSVYRITSNQDQNDFRPILHVLSNTFHLRHIWDSHRSHELSE